MSNPSPVTAVRHELAALPSHTLQLASAWSARAAGLRDIHPREIVCGIGQLADLLKNPSRVYGSEADRIEGRKWLLRLAGKAPLAKENARRVLDAHLAGIEATELDFAIAQGREVVARDEAEATRQAALPHPKPSNPVPSVSGAQLQALLLGRKTLDLGGALPEADRKAVVVNLRRFPNSPKAQALARELERLRHTEVRNRSVPISASYSHRPVAPVGQVRPRFEMVRAPLSFGMARRQAISLASLGLRTPDLSARELQYLLRLLRKYPRDAADALYRKLAARESEITSRENAPSSNDFAQQVRRSRFFTEADARNRQASPRAAALAKVRAVNLVAVS